MTERSKIMWNKIWVVILLVFIGCGLEDFTINPNERHVKINVEPQDARVVVKSMSDSRIRTLEPPYDLRYILRPYQATYVEVSRDGYRRKIVKLDGTREEINIKLQKLTEEEKMMLKYKTNAMGRAGPSLEEVPGVGGGGGGMGGTMGGTMGGAPGSFGGP
jgi:hypothetical protein